MIGFLATSGISCLAVALVPKEIASDKISWNSILIIIFASLGKAAASGALNSCYIITLKFYPTSVRSSLMSIVISKFDLFYQFIRIRFLILNFYLKAFGRIGGL